MFRKFFIKVFFIFSLILFLKFFLIKKIFKKKLIWKIFTLQNYLQNLFVFIILNLISERNGMIVVKKYDVLFKHTRITLL